MAASPYLNLDLLIESVQDAYRIKVASSPAGETDWHVFSLPFTDDELRAFFWQSGQRPRGFVWKGTDDPETPPLDPQGFGERLFRSVFDEAIRDCLVGSLNQARAAAGLRIRLRLHDVPELADLPWEYLYDPRPHRNGFFALSDQTPLVRYLELPNTTQALIRAEPLRILVMISNPTDVPPQLDVEDEWDKLQQVFHELEAEGQVEVERLEHATLTMLRSQLRRTEYHVFHFIGHGRLNPQTQEGELLLEDEASHAHLVSAAALKTHIGDHRTLQLAFLNACDGARGSARNIFTGTAQGLVQRGLPAVVAMQFPVTDQAAIALAQEFYAALVDGYPVDAALTEARKRLVDETNRRTVEWGTPVLFMRTPDGRLLDREMAPRQEPGDSPYKGLQFFDVPDAHLFFGREQLTAELVALLRSQRFLAVVGASGSGKSSLVRAGMVPALQHGEPLSDGTVPPEDSVRWPIHIITPTAHPLKALAARLTVDSESVRAQTTLMDDLAADARSLDLYANRLLASHPSSATRLLLVVDQFEEVFTLCRDQAERRAFVDNLLYAAADDGVTIVLITLRADFYAHCAEFDNLRTALERHQRYIGLMSTAELRRAIEAPAQQGGWEFEPGLVEEFLHDVGAGEHRQPEPGALPLLSHALLETWKRRRGRTLTFVGYHASGGVQGAIAQTAETVFNQKLTPEQQAIARNIFLRLTELGEGAQDTRRRVTLEELIPQSDTHGTIETVLKTLADARLITTFAGEAEVAHEALIREWPTLRNWLADDREGLRIHRRLTEATHEWEALQRDPGALYRGVRLEQTLEWMKEHTEELNAQERDFLNASVAFVEAEEREKQATLERELAAQMEAEQERERAELSDMTAKELRKRAIALTLSLIIAVTAATASVWLFNIARIERQDAEAQRDNAFTAQAEADALREEAEKQTELAIEARGEAEDQRRQVERLNRFIFAQQLASQAIVISEQYPEQALLIALESMNVDRSLDESHIPAAEQSLRDILAKTGGTIIGDRHKEITAMAFNPDGHTLAIANDDASVHLWTVENLDREPVVLRGHLDSVTALAFSPDGRQLVTAGDDYTAQLWDVKNPAASPIALRGHTKKITAVNFSPDGRWLATASWDGTARLWNVMEPTANPVVLSGHVDGIHFMAFSQDSRWIATSTNGNDRSVRVWDVNDPTAEPIVLPYAGSLYSGLVFSPDARWLTTGRRLWDLQSVPVESKKLIGQSDYPTLIKDVIFNPNGQWLATANTDHTARLWNMKDTDSTPVILRGHESSIQALTFDPTGRWLVTGSADHTARLWDLENLASDPVVLRGHEGGIEGVMFSPNGRWLATQSADRTVRLWDVNSPFADPISLQAGKMLLDHYHPALKFSPDGHWLVTGPFLRRMDDLIDEPIEHHGNPFVVEFSPDSRWLAAGTRLLDLSNSTADFIELDLSNLDDDPLFELLDESARHDGVRAIAFSPDGKLLAVSIWQSILIYEVKDLIAGPIAQIDFGNMLDTPTVRSYPLSNGISTLMFNPDGRWLISQSESGTVFLWDSATPTHELYLLSKSPHEDHSTTFSPDGNLLAIAIENFVHLYKVQDLTKNSVLHEVSGGWLAVSNVSPNDTLRYEGTIINLNFSTDGRWLAVSSEDPNAAILWSMDDSRVEPFTLSEHSGGFESIIFSPDGQKLVTASRSPNSAFVWDMENPTANPVLLSSNGTLGYTGATTADADGSVVRFSPNGQWFAKYTEPDTVHLWTIQTELLVKLACATAGRNLSPQEWVQYFPDKEYQITCPNMPPDPSITLSFLDAAKELAHEGKITAAVDQYQKALELNSDLDIAPQMEVQRLVSLSQFEKASIFASTGEIDIAVELFMKAFKFTSPNSNDLQNEAQKLAEAIFARNLVDEILTLIYEENIEAGLAAYSQARKLDPYVVLTPGTLNSICWQGSLEGYSTNVLSACEQAVEAKPENGNYRDSRGLARALTGDVEGAIEDFEFYTTWAKETGGGVNVEWREAWIEALEANEDPTEVFDVETLEAIKHE